MDAESSGSSSPVQHAGTDSPPASTRLKRAALQSLPFKPENVTSVAQKLVDSLQTIKAKAAKSTKASATISLAELDNLLLRSQQVARLTSISAGGSDVVSGVGDDSTTVSSQISNLSDRLYAKLERMEFNLLNNSQSSETLPSATPVTLPPVPVIVGQRHESLYLADGNIVLAAISTDGSYTFFRVHQSMLSFQSVVFASMFTLPAPDNVADRETYDGVPLVRMPDKASDLESLLRVLYDPSVLPYRRLDPETPVTVYGTLAMATKYQMDTLRTRIVNQVLADWPTTLAGWDHLESEAETILGEHMDAYENTEEGDSCVNGLYLDDRLPEPGAAIRLAMDFDIPKLLPAAFYHLSRMKVDEDWETDHANPRSLNDHHRTVRWHLLHAEDLKRLLMFRQRLGAFVQGEMPDMRNASGCLTISQCKHALTSLGHQLEITFDPLKEMKAFATPIKGNRGLCGSCAHLARADMRADRELLWDRLSSFVKQ